MLYDVLASWLKCETHISIYHWLAWKVTWWIVHFKCTLLTNLTQLIIRFYVEKLCDYRSLFFYIRERNDWECSGKYFFVVGDASDDDDDDGKPSKTNTIYMYHMIIYCLYFYLSNEVYG